jgi:hypothetical protein
MSKLKFIPLMILLFLLFFTSFVSSAHYLSGLVNNAGDGTNANDRIITIWKTSQSTNITDIIGVNGQSGYENYYMVDCEMLGECNIGDIFYAKVFNNGSNYITNISNVTITGAGFDSFQDLTLFQLGSSYPYFITIPANQSISYGTPFGVTFSATSDSTFGTYYLGNWTNYFSINSSGYLKNITIIPVGNYIINVSINDTSGNTNMTWYNLNVTTPVAPPSSCYQESANTSNLLSRDTQNCGLIYAGSYSTNASSYLLNIWTNGIRTQSAALFGAYFNINYTKPTFSINAIWAVNLYGVSPYDGNTNISIPVDCFNYNVTNLSLKVIFDSAGYTTLYCYNGSWKNISSYYTYNSGISEEAIIWSMNTNLLPINLTSPTSVNAYAFNSSYPRTQFNWTINSLYSLLSCGYNYNGTNISKSCTSGVPVLENISLNSKNNITIYAMDIYGNFNSSIFTWDYNYTDASIYAVNWTNLPSNMYFYNVTVCDKAGNCYTTTPERYYGLETLNQTLLINNYSRNVTAELGSPILITAHSNAGLVCLDSDYPTLGVNFACGLNDLVYNVSFNWFRKTTNLVTSIFNSSNSYTNISISSNTYDSVDNISLLFTGIIENLTIYQVNSTKIDKYFKGTLLGSSILDTTFSDFNSSKQLTMNPGSPTYVYLLMSSNASKNTLQFNLNGSSYGIDFLDSLENNDYIASPLYSLYKGFLYPLTSQATSPIAFENCTDTSQWTFSGNSLAPFSNPPGYGGDGSVTNSFNTVVLTTSVQVQGESATNSNSMQLNKASFNLHNADNVAFRYSYPNTGRRFADAGGVISQVSIGSISIYSPPTRYGGGDYNYWPWGDSNVTINIVRNDSSNVNVYLGGADNLYEYISDGCTTGRDETRTTLNNYTSGIQTVTRGNCLPAQCTGGNCISQSYINNSFTYSINYDASQITVSNSASAYDSGSGSIEIATSIYPMTADSLAKTNSSSYTILSQPVTGLGYNILAATLQATDSGNVTYYMSADAIHYELVQKGVLHTFSYPGSSLKWKAILNSSAGANGYALGGNATHVRSVQITTPTGYPTNLTIDYGADGTVDAQYNGTLNSSNMIDLSSIDLNPLQYGTLQFGDSYLVPIKITSQNIGLLNISGLNFIYNLGRISLNTTAYQNYLDNLPAGVVNVTIPMNASSGQITVSDINYDYAGGNQSYYVRAHNLDYSINQTYWINNFYSRWSYLFAPVGVDFIQFSPKNPTAKNVSVYGQTVNTPIMNLTNKAYYNSTISTPFTISNFTYNFSYTQTAGISNTVSINDNVTNQYWRIKTSGGALQRNYDMYNIYNPINSTLGNKNWTMSFTANYTASINTLEVQQLGIFNYTNVNVNSARGFGGIGLQLLSSSTFNKLAYASAIYNNYTNVCQTPANNVSAKSIITLVIVGNLTNILSCNLTIINDTSGKILYSVVNNSLSVMNSSNISSNRYTGMKTGSYLSPGYIDVNWTNFHIDFMENNVSSNAYSNLFVYIANNNLTCVNMTVNYNPTKPNSYIPYNTWTSVLNNTVQSQVIPIWLYADYNCSYNTWRYFQPTLYYKFCANGVDICSEELV